MAPYEKSEALFRAASELMPGGVNSPVRAWQAVGLTPRIITHGSGARVFDVDGNSYLDYRGLLGALDPGARGAGGGGGGGRGGGPGHQLRGLDAGGTGAGPGALRRGAGAGHGAPGQLRHRGRP